MLSLAYVLECDGYGRLILEVLSEPNEPRRLISGTTAILCDLDVCEEASVDVDVEVRTRSVEWRLDSGGSSVLVLVLVSSSLEAEERVLWERLLLWRSRSRSRSLSLLRELLRSRSGSFLRRRCESEEFNMANWEMAWSAGRCCDCVGRESRAGQGFCGLDHQRGYELAGLGVTGGHVARLRLSGEQLAMHPPGIRPKVRCGEGFAVLGAVL